MMPLALATETRTIRAQPSWIMRSSNVELAVTHLGGQMAPVFFDTQSPLPVQPYAISPWQGETENLPEGGSELPLRGDFFCLPFGKGDALNGECHPPHGQTSSGRWTHLSSSSDRGIHTMDLCMDLPVRDGRIVRTFTLRDGEDVVYSSTQIDGFAGPTTLGHHAVLSTPAVPQTLLLSTTPLLLGMTCPYPFARPEEGNYQSLATAKNFTELGSVPSAFSDAPLEDCSAFPIRPGFTDLVQFAQTPDAQGLAWTAVVNTEQGYLWFALKNAAILPSTILWIENHGRHGAPWSGRNCSLAIEDVCSFFDTGIAASAAPNAFSERKIPTIRNLKADSRFTVPYIQGIVRTPQGFGRVHAVAFESGQAFFSDTAGKVVSTRVDYNFLLRPTATALLR